MTEKEKTKTEEMEEFFEKELEKEITQEDSVDPSVELHLQQMGFLWDRMQHKLREDSTCFACKKIMDFTKDTEKLHLREASATEKGVIAFVSICQSCIDKVENDKIDEQVKKNE